MTDSAFARPSPLSLWLQAVRPHTLTLSAVPVVVGGALAVNETGQVQGPALLAALVGAVLIQAGTNLHNDAADFERGNDGPDRLGQRSLVATGVLSAAEVMRAATACFTLSALIGLYLVVVGGWPILALGVLSILSGWAYTGGPRPIAYTPLSELFVMAFFGLGAVGGTYWLAAGRLSVAAIVAGLAIGSFATAVLLVNNHRDVAADARVGRWTLAMLLGASGSRAFFAVLMIAPFALLAPLGALLPHGLPWLAMAPLPAALWLSWRLALEPRGPLLNRILAQTAQTQLAYGLALCLGLLL